MYSSVTVVNGIGGGHVIAASAPMPPGAPITRSEGRRSIGL